MTDEVNSLRSTRTRIGIGIGIGIGNCDLLGGSAWTTRVAERCRIKKWRCPVCRRLLVSTASGEATIGDEPLGRRGLRSRSRRIAQPAPAEAECRRHHRVPEGPDIGSYAELDTCLGMALDQVPDLGAARGLHRCSADPIAGRLVVDRLEGLGRHAIGVELTSHHSPCPCGLDHV